MTSLLIIPESLNVKGVLLQVAETRYLISVTTENNVVSDFLQMSCFYTRPNL